MNGILATVATSSTGGSESSLRTVLPHPSLLASAHIAEGSSEHERFLEAASKPGAKLSFHTQVNTSNPFVPAVQPGSTLDWDLKNDPFAATPFTVRSDYEPAPQVAPRTPADNPFQEVQLAGATAHKEANGLFLASATGEQILTPARFHLPWAAESTAASANPQIAKTRTDVHGNWERGREVYFGDGGCASCHTVRDEGIPFGPDLSNLIHRDRESVLQDILQPSATINPDHIGTLVVLKDGSELYGILRKKTEDQVVLALPAGAEVELRRERIQKIEPMRHSLMPVGIDYHLDKDQIEDLLAFLLTEKPSEKEASGEKK